MTTATEVMKFRNEGKSLTPEFCISILEKSDNGSVSFKLLEVIKSHIEHHPQTLHEYAPILSELWYRSIKRKKNTNFLARMIEENIEKTNMTANELKAKLLEYGIAIRNCENYPGLNEYFVRFAVRTREENDELIDALTEILA